MGFGQADAVEGGLGEVHTFGTVDLLGHALNLALDGVVVGIGEGEGLRGLLLDGINHELRHLHCTFATLGIGIVDDEGQAQFGLAVVAKQGHLFVGVRSKTVEHDDDALTKRAEVLHMAVEVFKALSQTLHVGFFDSIEGHAAVHLQALCGGHDDRECRLESALAAEDIVEFLRAEVSAETSLRDGVFAMAEGHLGGQKRVAAVGDVGERSAVNHCGRILGGLYEVGLDSVVEEHHNGACHAQVANGEGLALVGIAQQDVFNAATQVGLVGGQAEDGHQFAGRRDVEASLCGQAIGGGAQTRDDGAQRAVVDVEDAAPEDFLQAEAVLGVLVEVVIEQGRNHVVGRSDGVEVAREVEIDFLHRQHLGMATAGGTALHAKARTERRFAEGDNGLLSYFIEAQGQADGNGRLANTRLGGGDGSHEDEFAFGLGDEVEGEFGNVLAVVFNLLGRNLHGGSHFVNILERCAVGNF